VRFHAAAAHFRQFTAASRNRFIRVAQEGTVTTWSIGDLAFYNRGTRVEVGGPYNSQAHEERRQRREWVYVDLGAGSTFDRVVLDWIERAAAGSIQTSNDAVTWKPCRRCRPLGRWTI